MKTLGVNHVALVCRDMEETVKFYTEVMNMPLVKTVALPDGGQHFFFDCGGGACIAFFWWADAPPAAPGVASVKKFPEDAKTAHASMNHIAFHVEEHDLKAWIARLKAYNVPLLPIVVNHDDSDVGIAMENHDGVFIRSVYFTDPNGVMLEVAATTRAFGPNDVRHAPARAAAMTEA